MKKITIDHSVTTTVERNDKILHFSFNKKGIRVFDQSTGKGTTISYDRILNELITDSWIKPAGQKPIKEGL
jgi:hypothetical protein